MNAEKEVLLNILKYLNVDLDYANYAQLQSYVQWYKPEPTLNTRIKELESRIKLLLSSTQSWEAVAADKQARIEELEGENERLKKRTLKSGKSPWPNYWRDLASDCEATAERLRTLANIEFDRAEKAESKLEAVREFAEHEENRTLLYILNKEKA